MDRPIKCLEMMTPAELASGGQHQTIKGVMGWREGKMAAAASKASSDYRRQFTEGLGKTGRDVRRRADKRRLVGSGSLKGSV